MTVTYSTNVPQIHARKINALISRAGWVKDVNKEIFYEKGWSKRKSFLKFDPFAKHLDEFLI